MPPMGHELILVRVVGYPCVSVLFSGWKKWSGKTEQTGQKLAAFGAREREKNVRFLWGLWALGYAYQHLLPPYR